jgi:hypothetical protein
LSNKKEKVMGMVGEDDKAEWYSDQIREYNMRRREERRGNVHDEGREGGREEGRNQN